MQRLRPSPHEWVHPYDLEKVEKNRDTRPLPTGCISKYDPKWASSHRNFRFLLLLSLYQGEKMVLRQHLRERNSVIWHLQWETKTRKGDSSPLDVDASSGSRPPAQTSRSCMRSSVLL